MKFNSQICTTEEQSKRLLALGLKRETADMCYQVKFFNPFPRHLVDCTPSLLTHPPINDERFIPAWSLHRLIEMIPFNLKDKRGYIYDFVIEDNNTISYYYFAEQFWHCNIYWGKSNLYDNFIDCIEWLIKEGYFNKEYLKE